MTDPPPYPDTGDDRGTPRWVKVFGIIALIVLLLIVVVMSIGGGEHGPGRHAPSGGARDQAPPSHVVMEDHTPPDGRHG